MQVRLGEGNVLDLGVGPDPVEPLAVLAPEALGIGDRAGVHVVVLGAIDVGRPGDGFLHSDDRFFGHLPLPRRRFPAPPGDRARPASGRWWLTRTEEHTSELQSLMRISYAVFYLKKKRNKRTTNNR